jgi:hypothetical protein
MPETTGNRAQEEFILSIRGLDDSWAATQLQDLIRKEQKDEDFPPITDLIAEFRSYYRRTRPIASGLGTFATLEVAGSSNSQEALQGAQAGGKRQSGSSTLPGPWIPRCLDGEKHTFENCPYVNQSVRKKGWKLDKAIQDKFTELRDSPTTNLKANALRAVERTLKKKPQAEVQSSSVISIDDGQEAGFIPHVNAVLQTAAATGVVDPPLLTRWILDPGSNCHVTNMRGTDWAATQKGGPSDVVFMSYDGTEPVYLDRQTLREVVKILDIPELPEETDQETEILLQSAHTIGSNASQLEPDVRAEQAKDTTHALPSPKNTPEPGLQPEPELELEPDPKSIEIPRGWELIPSDAEAPDRRSNNAPRRDEIGSQLSKSNVLTKRMQGKTLGRYFVAFAAARQLPEPQKARLHRDQLLPPLRRWRDLEKHLFRREFMAAEAKEFKRCQDMRCLLTGRPPDRDQSPSRPLRLS